MAFGLGFQDLTPSSEDTSHSGFASISGFGLGPRLSSGPGWAYRPDALKPGLAFKCRSWAPQGGRKVWAQASLSGLGFKICPAGLDLWLGFLGRARQQSQKSQACAQSRPETKALVAMPGSKAWELGAPAGLESDWGCGPKPEIEAGDGGREPTPEIKA